MDTNLTENFSLISGEICNLLYLKNYNKERVNLLIDELNTKPFKGEIFVRKHDATTLITALCLNVKCEDEYLAAKVSHLINSIITKQNLLFETDYLWTVLSWYIECLGKYSDIIILDILHNMQCILQLYPQASYKFIDELIGSEGVLVKQLVRNKSSLGLQSPLQKSLIALKCIICILSIEDKTVESYSVAPEIKDRISRMIVEFLMKGITKYDDEFLYCKVIISALGVLSQLYFNDPNVFLPLPEVMGICRYFILYGLVTQGDKPERIIPSQQTLAVMPTVHTTASKGGKKQKIRKQRNNAIETLKKEIPVSDHSLMKDIDNFENNAAYKPVIRNYLEPQKAKNCWALTSDSDMSDVESNREMKVIALRSRVRQSASNVLLVLVKVKEKKDIFGYWWALLPDSPDSDNWCAGEGAKRTLAYGAVTDPIAGSRAAVLSVMLALLSGSRMYLSQAETSKKETASFIPFSESLGYFITCLHRVLISILSAERSHAVVIVALKCCAALLQATPYHRMKGGLITDLVMSIRKFLVHRDVTLQVGALITMGCVLSVNPKVDEVLKAIEKDTAPRPRTALAHHSTDTDGERCEDFEEGYSDDEMFTALESNTNDTNDTFMCEHVCFRSWILDICFKNMGWAFRGNGAERCKPSAIPVVLESLQVLTATAFHHLPELLHQHMMLLGDILSELLQHENQDVVLQSARLVTTVGDAVLKLEQIEQSPPLAHCVYFWQGLVAPLSAVLQSDENWPAKAVVCDCIANIGDRSFKMLPRRQRVVCCTLLTGVCGDEQAAVRAAAVRALAMLVVYRSLRHDVCFVSDCGESVLRALAERVPAVRAKAAWALGNLSDALVLNAEDPDADEIDDNLLVRLLEVSVRSAADCDKVKMSATRGLGNLLRIVTDENLLRTAQMKALCESGIGKLLECACSGTGMKVRWNACHALGNAMANERLFTRLGEWRSQVFSKLCVLARECKNLKVRINAAVALRAPAARAHYGPQYALVWRGVMAAMETALHVDDFTVFMHKDNLVEQLCVTLAHLCCLLTQSDLADVLDPLIFYYDAAKSLFAQVCHKLPPEDASCLRMLRAAKYVTVELAAAGDTQLQALAMLQDIFVFDM